MIRDKSFFCSALVSQISCNSGNAKSIAAIAKAGRGAKVDSRAIRIIHILRAKKKERNISYEVLNRNRYQGYWKNDNLNVYGTLIQAY